MDFKPIKYFWFLISIEYLSWRLHNYRNKTIIRWQWKIITNYTTLLIPVIIIISKKGPSGLMIYGTYSWNIVESGIKHHNHNPDSSISSSSSATFLTYQTLLFCNSTQTASNCCVVAKNGEKRKLHRDWSHKDTNYDFR